jgi:hypothetical protein
LDEALIKYIGKADFEQINSERRLIILPKPTGELHASIANKKTWNLNATVPFKVSIVNTPDHASIQDIKVKVLSGDKILGKYVEGKGASAIRMVDENGEYMVNINTKALALKEGNYNIRLEFKVSSITFTYDTEINLSK